MKKLKIAELKVTSFVTQSGDMMGGGFPASLTCIPVTCAPACSETRGGTPCKQETNNC